MQKVKNILATIGRTFQIKSMSDVVSGMVVIATIVYIVAGGSLGEVEETFSSQAARSQRFQHILANQLTVLNDTEFRGDVTQTGDQTLTGDVTLTGDLDLTGDVTLTGNIANRSLFLRYQDVTAAPSVYAETAVVSTTTSITTSILGIETPRNIVLTWVTVTTATAGNVTVVGIDARGPSTTELVAVSATSGTQTLTGVVPWQSITSFTLPTRTEALTLTVTGGQKFGLPLVPQAADDLYHLTVNATPQAAPTVNATYGTFDPVSTPAANVDYNVWLKQ